eukprot:6980513-Pyramimonas_sp.AAC.1
MSSVGSTASSDFSSSRAAPVPATFLVSQGEASQQDCFSARPSAQYISAPPPVSHDPPMARVLAPPRGDSESSHTPGSVFPS